MKALFYTLLAMVFLTFVGSFLDLWSLPFVDWSYTYHDLSVVLEKLFYDHVANDPDFRARVAQ